MIIGGKKFDVEHETYVMGILNVTPDSFSDGGKYNGMDQAMEHARQMVEDGADIIDVGGESTRPGHIMITDEEEIARVTPIIEKLKKEFDVPISIDTYKSKVAEAAVQAGADLVNDIWGLKYDKKIAGEILDTLSENDAFSETERAWILEAVRGHRRKCNGMSEVARLFYECDKRSRNCFACPVKEQCNWSEEEKNMEIKI